MLPNLRSLSVEIYETTNFADICRRCPNLEKLRLRSMFIDGFTPSLLQQVTQAYPKLLNLQLNCTYSNCRIDIQELSQLHYLNKLRIDLLTTPWDRCSTLSQDLRELEARHLTAADVRWLGTQLIQLEAFGIWGVYESERELVREILADRKYFPNLKRVYGAFTSSEEEWRRTRKAQQVLRRF